MEVVLKSWVQEIFDSATSFFMKFLLYAPFFGPGVNPPQFYFILLTFCLNFLFIINQCQHYVLFLHYITFTSICCSWKSGDLLNNLLFIPVEITETPNKLFMMFLCQCSCHAQHFLIPIDLGHRIKTNIKQKLTKNIKV